MKYKAFEESINVSIYQLTENLILAGNLLYSGTYILGFNDNGSDKDFDDLVVAAWNSEGGIQPVPVPAAVWMLGTGLVGVMGMRWRQRA